MPVLGQAQFSPYERGKVSVISPSEKGEGVCMERLVDLLRVVLLLAFQVGPEFRCFDFLPKALLALFRFCP